MDYFLSLLNDMDDHVNTLSSGPWVMNMAFDSFLTILTQEERNDLDSRVREKLSQVIQHSIEVSKGLNPFDKSAFYLKMVNYPLISLNDLNEIAGATVALVQKL